MSTLTPDKIRNLSIVAHIDHGKSTLSDRILELTGAVDPRDMRDQYLDSMDIERERGITIKAQNVRVEWKGYTVHLIDTPGHVDFGYEVSRSLAACEGVVLLVDAAQGIEAQTLAHAYLALEHDLEIVVVLNKIDLPAADPERCAAEIEAVLGIPASETLRVSAKTGEGVPELLDAICARIPPPKGDPDAPLQALIFDSLYDQYRGVVSSIRVVNGVLSSREKLRFMQTGRVHDVEELGVRLPATTEVQSLGPGEVGYLIAGIKDVGEARSGETVTEAGTPGGETPGGVPGTKANGVLRALPGGRGRVRGSPDCSGKTTPERLLCHLPARIIGGPRLWFSLWVPRPAPYGHRPRAAGEGVRPHPYCHGPECRVHRPFDRRQ